ncbi:hypothetical protein [Embleya scabrispora]|uniref:hypothetical protein n=1 Tax=Embleya scabrispora TaxID=159449 RepID=UPI0003A7F916|nr:hypothetical protein [Embleya scabrispora]MYS80873.1 hypothetical protein [Streptomyces sp. SID5474]
MRRVRVLVAGTALGFAALTLAVPSAYADEPSSENNSDKSWSADSKWTPDKSSEHSDNKGNDNRGNDNRGNDNRGNDSKGNDSYSHDKSGKDHKSPHGGVHTGIGGAFLDDGAALGTGAALIAGGIGMGAYALRRRSGAAAAQA